jgi:hypothetical protein
MDNMAVETTAKLSTYGGWIIGGLTFLLTVMLAYIIRPIRDKGLKNEREIEDLKMKQVEQETTLKMYIETQSSIQRSLGKIDLRLY